MHWLRMVAGKIISFKVCFHLTEFSFGGTTSITYTQYFDQYQFLQVKKSGGLNRAHPHDDYFEGRMVT